MFKYKPYLIKNIHDGIQYIFKFDNKYGASVVNNKYAYVSSKDNFELAILKFNNNDNYILTYDTSITDDVIPDLTVKEINHILDQIKILDKNGLFKQKIYESNTKIEVSYI